MLYRFVGFKPSLCFRKSSWLFHFSHEMSANSITMLHLATIHGLIP